jgi:CBS domain-containing protein
MALLVRDVMTIGVPVCRCSESCGVVAGRLASQPARAEAVVALDENGRACGWATREQLTRQPAARPVAEVVDEDIPAVPPDIPALAALQLMEDRGVSVLFLMHDWPGEARPAAYLSRRTIEEKVLEAEHASSS